MKILKLNKTITVRWNYQNTKEKPEIFKTAGTFKTAAEP